MAKQIEGDSAAGLAVLSARLADRADVHHRDHPVAGHILDEATANVDPENEDRLQKAIEALTDHSHDRPPAENRPQRRPDSRARRRQNRSAGQARRIDQAARPLRRIRRRQKRNRRLEAVISHLSKTPRPGDANPSRIPGRGAFFFQ